jgi:hypothetical protein
MAAIALLANFWQRQVGTTVWCSVQGLTRTPVGRTRLAITPPHAVLKHIRSSIEWATRTPVGPAMLKIQLAYSSQHVARTVIEMADSW